MAPRNATIVKNDKSLEQKIVDGDQLTAKEQAAADLLTSGRPCFNQYPNGSPKDPTFCMLCNPETAPCVN